MGYDNHHCLSGAQTKTWAEHELCDVTQRITNAATACAQDVSAGSDQQDMKELANTTSHTNKMDMSHLMHASAEPSEQQAILINDQITREIACAKEQYKMQLAKET